MLTARAASHAVLLGAIAVIIVLLYARVSGAWFCGYDDFSEAHRAAFADSADPVRIFTTTHNMHFMYRPVTSGLQYVTWNAAHHSPLGFRLRNLVMHLISIGMLYGIIFLITSSRSAAAGAALLFGLHPMSNETVVVAIWTNATAYALTLSSLFLFLLSLHSLKAGGNWKVPLMAALSCALVSIFTYEPTIAIFPIMAAYLWVWRARTASMPRRYVTWFLAGVFAELLVFFFVRHLVITQAAPFNSITSIVRNAVMYGIALILPVDFVLAHVLLGTPLPSQAVEIDARTLLPAAVAIAALAIVTAVAVVRARGAIRFRTFNSRLQLFLIAAIIIAVLPLLLFKDHASEHDLYLSAALYCGALGILLSRWIRSRIAYAIAIGCLAVSFALGIWVRNERVTTCATIAHTIVTQLPVSRWKEGRRRVLLATPQGERLGEPYGAYNDYGLNTLETEKGLTPGATYALQLATGNTRITVDIVKPAQIARNCSRPFTCFWVSRAGNVTDVVVARRTGRQVGANNQQ